MNAPFRLPSEASLAPAPFQSEAPAAEVIYIDLDFLDAHKIARQAPYRLSTDAWRC